jgi:hypothetical protein
VTGTETRLTLKPGMPGTKKLTAQHREKLLCVRYRYDLERGLRIKTIELIVEEVPWRPRPRIRQKDVNELVGIRIAPSETALRRRVMEAGGIWRPRQVLWEVPWGAVRRLGLAQRVQWPERYRPKPKAEVKVGAGWND